MDWTRISSSTTKALRRSCVGAVHPDPSSPPVQSAPQVRSTASPPPLRCMIFFFLFTGSTHWELKFVVAAAASSLSSNWNFTYNMRWLIMDGTNFFLDISLKFFEFFMRVGIAHNGTMLSCWDLFCQVCFFFFLF